MTQEKVQLKTYVGGSFLYSDNGLDYQEKHRETQERVFQDKAGLMNLQRELKQKKNAQGNKKRMGVGNKIVEKPVLIPIRDTPVQPVPEPVLENQKCQRATQEQFEYFQTYISQKQKQRQFEEEEQRQIQQFITNQQKARERQTVPRQISLIMEKQDNKGPKQSKRLIKIKIKKKQDIKKNEQKQEFENISKVRIIE